MRGLLYMINTQIVWEVVDTSFLPIVLKLFLAELPGVTESVYVTLLTILAYSMGVSDIVGTSLFNISVYDISILLDLLVSDI